MRFLQFVFIFVFTSTLLAQRQPDVDFTKIKAEILPIADSKEIVGHVTYDFEVKAKRDSIYIDAVGITFLRVALNGKKIEYSNSGKQLGFKAPTTTGNHKLFLRYVTKPKQTVYFIQRDSILLAQQVWTQGQGKYTSHWLPSFDNMNEKIELDLTILSDEEHVVIANGELKEKFTEDGITEWKFDMLDPMSSYLAAFVVGNFDKKVIKSNSGIPIELYYEPKDSLKAEPTYRYTKQIIDFLEKEIGFPYPWQNYKQVPVQDFLYAGMENTGTTIFSNQYMIDSTAFVDKHYVNVNAHELAHQWFGNLVTEESGEHHWLHEGFATYYAYLAEQHLFGNAHFYWKLYNTAKTLHNLSENGDGEALTNPNANSLTFYEKGAWALVMLKELVGEEVFKNGVQAYLNKYQFQNVTISDFLSEMELVSNQDISWYRETWLASEEFPWKEVSTYLKNKEPSLKLFFEIKETTKDTTVFNEDKLMWLRGKEMPTAFKKQFILDYGNQIPDSSLSKIIKNESIKVRQAIALMKTEVSKELKMDFESLLLDESYVTKEVVLYKLWEAFPKDRTRYLNETKDVIGLPNKNVRLLWLALALMTPDYEPSKKQAFYQELNDYTAPNQHFEVRQSAFQYLNQIQALSDEAIKNLVKALDHHVWQFKKSSRNLIRELAECEITKKRLVRLKASLNQKEQEALLKILNE